MHFLTRVEKLLDMPTAEKQQVIRELKSHYFELRDDLIASGMNAAQAAEEAEKRLGSPEDVAARLGPVHNSATWRSALLTAVPFLMWGLISFIYALKPGYGLSEVLTLVFGGVMIAVSVRELIADRRPIWLTTWLAGAFLIITQIILIPINIYYMNESISVTVANMLGHIIIVIIMLKAIWKTPKWRVIGLVLCVIVSLSIVYTIANIPNSNHVISSNFMLLVTFASGISNIILTVLFAMLIFKLHDYGSGAQATLFLLTTYTVSFYMIPGQLGSGLALCNGLIVGVIVLLFARISSWQLKIISALAGLTIHFTLVSIYLQLISHQSRLLITGLVGTCIIQTVFTAVPVIIPILMERLQRRRDRVELVR